MVVTKAAVMISLQKGLPLFISITWGGELVDYRKSCKEDIISSFSSAHRK